MIINTSSDEQPPWMNEELPDHNLDPLLDIETSPLSNNEPSWVTPNAKVSSNNNNNANEQPPKSERKSMLRSVLKYKKPEKLILLGSNNNNNISGFDPILLWFRIFHLLATILVLIAGGINGYFVCKIALPLPECIIRIYTIIFCLIMILVEIEFDFIQQQMRILHYWIGRGCFYSFIGVITCKYVGITLANVIGIGLTVIGIIYVILGIFGLEGLEAVRSTSNSQQQQHRYQEIPADFMKSPDKD